MNQTNIATNTCEIKQRCIKRQTTQNRTQTMKSRKKHKKKLDIRENHLF